MVWYQIYNQGIHSLDFNGKLWVKSNSRIYSIQPVYFSRFSVLFFSPLRDDSKFWDQKGAYRYIYIYTGDSGCLWRASGPFFFFLVEGSLAEFRNWSENRECQCNAEIRKLLRLIYGSNVHSPLFPFFSAFLRHRFESGDIWTGRYFWLFWGHDPNLCD